MALLISLLSISLHASAEVPIPKNAMSALKTDNASLLIDSLDNGGLANCYSYKNSNYTLLIMTIKAGAIDSFKALLDKDADVDKTCSNKSPLMYAAKYGQLEMAKLLIKSGADHKYINRKGRTAKDYSKKYRQKQVYLYFKSLEAGDKSSSNTEILRD